MRSMANKANKNTMIKPQKSASKRGKSPYPESISSPVHQILSLQQTIGNLALQRLFYSGHIQAKLKIGKPNDIYEQEADRMAEQVMKMAENTSTSGHQLAIREKNESVQTKPT